MKRSQFFNQHLYFAISKNQLNLLDEIMKMLQINRYSSLYTRWSLMEKISSNLAFELCYHSPVVVFSKIWAVITAFLKNNVDQHFSRQNFHNNGASAVLIKINIAASSEGDFRKVTAEALKILGIPQKMSLECRNEVQSLYLKESDCATFSQHQISHLWRH